MSTLVRSQLLNSLRAEVTALDDKIEQAEYRIASFEYKFFGNARLHEERAELSSLHDERDAIIARIEETEEADDLIWDLVCAVNDAYDGEPLTQASLAAQLENYGLIVSRVPNLASPRERITKICGGTP